MFVVIYRFVARPNFDVENRALGYILNNNQFGFTAFAVSGETFPINTNIDLNGDGVSNDIPVGLERNAGSAPGLFNPTTGELLFSSSDLYQRFTPSAQESRQGQIGIKFIF